MTDARQAQIRVRVADWLQRHRNRRLDCSLFEEQADALLADVAVLLDWMTAGREREIPATIRAWLDTLPRYATAPSGLLPMTAKDIQLSPLAGLVQFKDVEQLVMDLLADPQAQEEHAEKHRCAQCGHRWEGPLLGAEYCGDCHRAVQARQGWQPISSAPKDGTTILVAGRDWIAPSSGYREGRWWTWHPPLLGERPQRSTAAEDPTYWMSIPPVPAQEPSE